MSQNERFFAFLDEYLQQTFNKTLERLIVDLMNYNKRDLMNDYFRIRSVSCINMETAHANVLKNFLKLKEFETGTFISGDSFLDEYIFIPAKRSPCFVLSNNRLVTAFSKYKDVMCHYPLRVDFEDEDIGKDDILVETENGEYLRYRPETFYEFIESDKVTKCECISYYDYLKDYLGENDYQLFTDKVKECNTRVASLANLPLSKLRKKNRDLFVRVLYQSLFEDNFHIILTPKEKETVTNYLASCPHHSEISKMVYTFSFTLKLFEKEKDLNDYLDLTFILVSAFKTVEVVFSDLLKSKFGNTKIVDSNGDVIDFSNENLTLGNMKQFFYTNNKEIKEFLSKQPTLKENTLQILNRWIKSSRNGFLHKDIVQVSNTKQLNESINDSIQLLSNLILLFNQ